VLRAIIKNQYSYDPLITSYAPATYQISTFQMTHNTGISPLIAQAFKEQNIPGTPKA